MEMDIQKQFEDLLNYSVESDEYWQAVHKIRMVGAEFVCGYILPQCASENSDIRLRAIDVLAQLDSRDESKTVLFLKSLLKEEQNDQVIRSCIYAIGHQYYHNHSIIDAIEKYSDHDNPDIRQAVATALPNSNCEEKSIKMLIKLMADEVSAVRDWATFSLGNLMNSDSPEIREAFIERLVDDDLDVVVEAIVALASRNDMRALPRLIWHLEHEDTSSALIDAAMALLDLHAVPENWGPKDFEVALREKFTSSR